MPKPYDHSVSNVSAVIFLYAAQSETREVAHTRRRTTFRNSRSLGVVASRRRSTATTPSHYLASRAGPTQRFRASQFYDSRGRPSRARRLARHGRQGARAGARPVLRARPLRRHGPVSVPVGRRVPRQCVLLSYPRFRMRTRTASRRACAVFASTRADARNASRPWPGRDRSRDVIFPVSYTHLTLPTN